MKKTNALALLMVTFMSPVFAYSSETVTVEPGDGAYSFVSHYRIAIDAPLPTVWRQLLNLHSWMYQFAMEHVSGTAGQEGEVLRIYSGQDFLAQITSAVPNELLVISNLPSTFQEEYSTGIGVITLNNAAGKTILDLTMSRRYTWRGSGPDQTKQTRESRGFQERTRTTWTNFLDRLRTLAEGGGSSEVKDEAGA